MTLPEVAWLAVRWYLALSLLSWILYPVLFRSLAALPDRGITLVRPLGMLLAGFLPWWLSAIGLVPYQNVVLIGLPVVAVLPLWIYEIRAHELGRFLWAERRTLVAAELAFGLLLGGYVVFRSFNPDIAFTEKPMELAMLTSSLSAQAMPPADPWFAGDTINYYYLGYVLAALPARLMEIRASVAFNLELATLFAGATVAAAGSAANFARGFSVFGRVPARVSAALAGILLVGIGNLVTPIELLAHPLQTLEAGWWQGVGWRASRVIVDEGSALGRATETINEFPAFSFVLGDLHPHVLAFPLFISAIAVTLALARPRPISDFAYAQSIGLAGLLLGALYAMNSWDMPPALLLFVAGLLVGSRQPLAWRSILRALGLVLGVAVAAALPFLLHYTSPLGANAQDIPSAIRGIPIFGTIAQTFGVVGWPKSSFVELLKVHGLFLAFLAPTLVAYILCLPRSNRPDNRLLVALPLALAFLAVAARFPAILLFGAPAIVAIWLFLNPVAPSGVRLLAGLAGIACTMVLVTEVVFLLDAFGNRMNTVFKVYFQVWAIFAVAAAVALPSFLSVLRRRLGKRTSIGFLMFALILVASAAAYPPLSAYRWTNGFAASRGIDGLGYLDRYTPDEAAAIDWLTRNVPAGESVLEAPGCSYGVSRGIPHDRVSMATGLPTVIGWQFHEYQWRNGEPSISEAINRRQQDARIVYDAPGTAEARAVLERYAIRYVYVGTFERFGYDTDCRVGPPYSSDGLAAFDQLGWPVAFRAGQVTIYRVPS